MANPTQADQICDLVVSELQGKIPGEFGFDLSFNCIVRDKPDFDLIEATETTQIQAAVYPNVDFKRGARRVGGVEQKLKMGIAVCKRIVMDDDGQPSTLQFRSLKGLMESLYEWAWIGVEPYQGQVSVVNFPAWYDINKAKENVFLSVVQIQYDAKPDA